MPNWTHPHLHQLLSSSVLRVLKPHHLSPPALPSQTSQGLVQGVSIFLQMLPDPSDLGTATSSAAAPATSAAGSNQSHVALAGCEEDVRQLASALPSLLQVLLRLEVHTSLSLAQPARGRGPAPQRAAVTAGSASPSRLDWSQPGLGSYMAAALLNPRLLGFGPASEGQRKALAFQVRHAVARKHVFCMNIRNAHAC